MSWSARLGIIAALLTIVLAAVLNGRSSLDTTSSQGGVNGSTELHNQ